MSSACHEQNYGLTTGPQARRSEKRKRPRAVAPCNPRVRSAERDVSRQGGQHDGRRTFKTKEGPQMRTTMTLVV